MNQKADERIHTMIISEPEKVQNPGKNRGGKKPK
jgi:hypothetical protein